MKAIHIIEKVVTIKSGKGVDYTFEYGGFVGSKALFEAIEPNSTDTKYIDAYRDVAFYLHCLTLAICDKTSKIFKQGLVKYEGDTIETKIGGFVVIYKFERKTIQHEKPIKEVTREELFKLGYVLKKEQ